MANQYLIFKTQDEYNHFYDDVAGYARAQASQIFFDLSARDKAIETAMDKMTDEILKRPQVDSLLAYSKTVVLNSLKGSVRANIQQEVYNKRYPRVRILEMPEGRERDICLFYWQDGLRQYEIATKLKVSRPYISQVIKRYSARTT